MPYADVLLPATTWGEKEGTVTNSERCISRVRAAVTPPGEAWPDWAIVRAFARKLEARLRPGVATLFPYSNPEAIFDEYRETTRARDLDITGLSYPILETNGPQQWPYPEGAHEGTRRLYEDGRFPTPTARASFAAVAYKPVAEQPTARHPFRLITGRLRDQWHGMSRTGRTSRLLRHTPEPRVTMNPADLLRRTLHDGDLVRIASARGAVTVPVEASDDVGPGQIFLPMHWGSAHLGGGDGSGVNAVTLPVFDPVSRQPELKHCAVRVTKAELPWRIVAFGCAPESDPMKLAETVRPLMAEFPFATCVLTGGKREGVLFRSAAPAAVDPAIVAQLDKLFGLDDFHTLTYEDARRGVGRRVRLISGAVVAVRLAGDMAAEPRLRDLFDSQVRADGLGPFLLAPGAEAGPRNVRGRAVCSCWNVSERDISEFVASVPQAGNAFEALQQALKCGTECGSCVPELKRMVALAKAAA